jgi:hypothetical protein
MSRSMLALLLVLSPSLSAARGEAVTPKMPGGKPLPQTVLFDRSIGIPWVWVAHKGFVPRELPGEDQRPVTDAKPLDFLQPCFYAATSELETATYLLLVKADETGKSVREHLGWVNARHVVQEPHAVRNLGNHIYAKVMLVNTLEFAGDRTEGGVNKFEHVPLLYGPVATAEAATDPVRLSTIFFVYGDTNPRYPKEGYALIGTDPSFKYEETITDPGQLSKIILGWVPKNRTCRWNTREAIEWDSVSTQPDAPRRRSQPGVVYKTLDDALKGLRGDPAVSIFREQFANGVSLPVSYDTARYPILDFEYEGTTLRKAKIGKNFLRRVGVAGGFVGKDGQTQLPLEKVEQLKRQLRFLQQQVELTEILFVIDDTESMYAWFPVVAQTVDRIVADVRKNPERKVRVALTYYNDTEDGKDLEKAVEAKPLVDAAGPAATALVKELHDHKVHAGYDPREQVFLGITRGIAAAHFHPYARKIVIVLGDMADHADENDPEHPGEKKIVDRLVPPDGAPIEFYAIQVIDPESRDDAKAFRKQMQTILGLYRERVDDGRRGGYDTTAKESVVRARILERYDQLKKEAEDFSQQIGRAGRGQWNTVMTPELERMLERPLKNIGIDLDELRRLDGFQVFQEGYVWQQSPDGVDQVRLSLLLSDGELEDYLAVLSRLNKDRSVKDLLSAAVRAPAGELKDRTRFGDDELLKRRGLEVDSWLLRKVVGEIPNEDTRTYLQELQSVRRKIGRLEDARQNRRYVYAERIVFHPSGIKFSVWDRTGEPIPAQRQFYIGSNRKEGWYWIDVAEEWP